MPLDRPVRITSLFIAKIRCFRGPVTIDFIPPDPGQWLIFLGDNGVGKTTLLRSIALALLPPQTASSLVEQYMSGTPLTSSGERVGSVTVGLDHQRFRVARLGDDEEIHAGMVRGQPA